MTLIHKHSFDSWGEYLEQATNPDIKRSTTENMSSQRDLWRGGVTWDEAVNLAIGGWEKGSDGADLISSPIFTKFSALVQREDIVFDVEGMEIDIARYVDGEPECWNRIERVIDKGQGQKIIKIVFNICASGVVDCKVITRKGAAVLSLIELLEYAGHRVELWVMTSIDNRHETWIKTKGASESVDKWRLAFALAHTAMFRRLIFNVWASTPLEIQDRLRGMGYGHGTPTEPALEDRGDIYIGTNMHAGGFDWSNPKSAESFVISELKNQGVVLEVKESAV